MVNISPSLQSIEADKSRKDVLETQIGQFRRENGEALKLRDKKWATITLMMATMLTMKQGRSVFNLKIANMIIFRNVL